MLIHVSANDLIWIGYQLNKQVNMIWVFCSDWLASDKFKRVLNAVIFDVIRWSKNDSTQIESHSIDYLIKCVCKPTRGGHFVRVRAIERKCVTEREREKDKKKSERVIECIKPHARASDIGINITGVMSHGELHVRHY